jgi:hypothetical protein
MTSWADSHTCNSDCPLCFSIAFGAFLNVACTCRIGGISMVFNQGISLNDPPARLIHGSSNDTYEDSTPPSRRFA